MSPKTLFHKYFAKRYVTYKERHKKNTLTDIRIMSQFCLVQHVNLFPYSLTRDCLGEPFHVACLLRPVFDQEKIESSEKLRVI